MIWERVLTNHEDFVPFFGAHLRTARTLAVLLYTMECVVSNIFIEVLGT
jgi:lauroyl/myristoyl acyltransferase